MFFEKTWSSGGHSEFYRSRVHALPSYALEGQWKLHPFHGLNLQRNCA